MNTFKLFLIFSLIFFFCFFQFSLVSLRVNGLTVEEGPFRLDLSGGQTWSLEFGIGDSRSLSNAGYPANAYLIGQSLQVSLDGQMGEAFSLTADLDDSRPGYLQEYGLAYNTDNWQGLAGNLIAGEGNFTVDNKKLLGLRLEGSTEGGDLQVLAGQLQGVSETKVFRGDSAEQQVEYSLFETEERFKEAEYKRNVRGLQHYHLEEGYVEGFTEPEVEFGIDENLKDYLEEWGLGYLSQEIYQQPRLDFPSGLFTIISGMENYLILNQDSLSIVRGRIENYISRHNQGADEEEKESYPFTRGTDYERQFLEGMEEYVNLVVGNQQFELANYDQFKFYSLGQKEVLREEFSLEIKRSKGWESVDELDSYDYELFQNEGLVQLDFPETFFADLEKVRIRAGFRYQVSGRTYMLGLSVIPDTERVYLNGERIERKVDYSLDYETGALILFRDLGSDDELRVEFERARGGPGISARYSRNLYGLRTQLESDYGLVMDIGLFQARDSAPEELPSDVSTMPNVHTVAGLEASYEENDWEANLSFAGNLNRFPFDDNQRVNLPNQMNDIVPLNQQGYDAFLFLHNNGFAVRDNGGWESYGTESGLSGGRVNEAITVPGLLFLATDSGLTALDLLGDNPFGRSGNWKSFPDLGGLGSLEVFGLAASEERLWLGTESGLFSAQLGSLEEAGAWQHIGEDYFSDLSVGSLIYFDGYLWVGSNEGLFLYDPSVGGLVEDSPIVEGKILDMELAAGSVFVVSAEGLTRIGTDFSKEPLLDSQDLNSVSINKGDVWVGSDQGFGRVGYDLKRRKEKVTAILATDSKIWVGTEGRRVAEQEVLTLYSYNGGFTAYESEETGIRGMDDTRFRDIPASQHTDRGISFAANLGRTFQVLTREVELSSDFEYVQPGYTPIGNLERKDRLAGGISLDVEVAEDLSVDLAGNHSISSFSTDQRFWSTSIRLSVDWTGPLDVGTDLGWRATQAGRRELGLDLTALKTFFGESLVLTGGLSVDREGTTTGRMSNFAAGQLDLEFSPTASVDVDLNYSRPITFGPLAARGRERFLWNYDFSRDISIGENYGVELHLYGDGNLDNFFYKGRESISSDAELNLTGDTMDLSGFSLSPEVSLSWEFSGASQVLTGEILGEFSTGDLSSRVSLSRSGNFSLASGRVRLVDELKGSLTYEFPDQKPRFDYELSRDQLNHPDFERKSKYFASLGVGTGWDLSPRLTNRVRLGAEYDTDRGVAFNLEDRLSWKITSQLEPELSLRAEYLLKTGELDFSSEARVFYPFANRWGISFSSGFNWTKNESGESHTGFFGSTELGVEF